MDDSEDAEESSDEESEFASDASEDSGSDEELDDSGEGTVRTVFDTPSNSFSLTYLITDWDELEEKARKGKSPCFTLMFGSIAIDGVT